MTRVEAAMSGPMFTGSIPALITPFRNGHVDEPAFQKFVDWQIREGTQGLVPCGTTHIIIYLLSATMLIP